jgi:hypothetical protein
MLLERTQVGKREMLADIIARVDAKQTPIMAMIPKGGEITNMLMEWQMDDFEDAEDLAVEDGVDVDTFDNASPNRFRAQTYAMKVRDTAMVSDLAENVSDVAGLSRGELAESIMKKLKKLGRSIEAAICGDQEHQAGAAGVPYRGRGLGVWIQSTPQALLPVDTHYLTPAASIDATASASLTTSIMDGLLDSSYSQTGESDNFVLIAGPGLKRAITDNFLTRVSTSNSQQIVRTYNTQFQGKVDNVVDTYAGDFGTVEIHPSLWLAHPAFGGSAAAARFRGYLLKMELLKLMWKRKPRVKQLEDRGGGPRFLVDAIVGWEVLNPLPMGKFAAVT